MACQDNKIVGRSPFTGLSNFIGIMFDPNFYHYLWTKFRFVLWNLVLVFFTPIVLAVMLVFLICQKVILEGIVLPTMK